MKDIIEKIELVLSHVQDSVSTTLCYVVYVIFAPLYSILNLIDELIDIWSSKAEPEQEKCIGFRQSKTEKQ